MRWEDTKRPLQLHTIHAPGSILLRSLQGREGLSQLFEYTLEVSTRLDEDALKKLVFSPVGVSLELPTGGERWFHGRVASVQFGLLRGDGYRQARLSLVPSLKFLDLSKNCRIFQNISVIELVEQLLHEAGLTDFQVRCVSSGRARREYCVQYQESTLSFILRLLEEEGIYFFFECSSERHLLVLADDPVQHPPCPGPSRVGRRVSSGFAQAREGVQELLRREEARTTRVALSDFNFEMPSTSLHVSVSDGSRFEEFYYPGGFGQRARGEDLARQRLEMHSVRFPRLEGSSDIRGLTAGHSISIVDPDFVQLEPLQVVLAVEHEAQQPLEAGRADAAFQYSNQFVIFPHSQPFRPPRLTPRPHVRGAQTAIVVGKAGEEIWTDRYGRVKVQFHWDREGQRSENASCWVRVSQAWAGSGWGAFYLPRVGQEVIVDFLEGDPDRPIVVGRVYNAENMPPLLLPAQQTCSTIKSNSSKGGGGFNELRFEDRTGGEEIYLHAQRDLREEIGQHHLESIQGSHTEEIGGDDTTRISGLREVRVGGSYSVCVEKGAYQLQAQGNNILLESATQIQLKTGKASLILSSDGSITLKGTHITIDSSGPISTTASSDHVIQGARVLINC